MYEWVFGRSIRHRGGPHSIYKQRENFINSYWHELRACVLQMPNVQRWTKLTRKRKCERMKCEPTHTMCAVKRSVNVATRTQIIQCIVVLLIQCPDISINKLFANSFVYFPFVVDPSSQHKCSVSISFCFVLASCCMASLCYTYQLHLTKGKHKNVLCLFVVFYSLFRFSHSFR